MEKKKLREKFESFIAEYATPGTFPLTVCNGFPDQYDDVEVQMLYDAFTAGTEAAQGERQPYCWVREKQGMMTVMETKPGPDYGSGWQPVFLR